MQEYLGKVCVNMLYAQFQVGGDVHTLVTLVSSATQSNSIGYQQAYYVIPCRSHLGHGSISAISGAAIGPFLSKLPLSWYGIGGIWFEK